MPEQHLLVDEHLIVEEVSKYSDKELKKALKKCKQYKFLVKVLGNNQACIKRYADSIEFKTIINYNDSLELLYSCLEAELNNRKLKKGK